MTCQEHPARIPPFGRTADAQNSSIGRPWPMGPSFRAIGTIASDEACREIGGGPILYRSVGGGSVVADQPRPESMVHIFVWLGNGGSSLFLGRLLLEAQSQRTSAVWYVQNPDNYSPK